MKASKFLTIALVLMSLLSLSLMPGAAQGPEPAPKTQAPTGTQALLGSAFTYQGYLSSDGTPVDDRCDFKFSLYDASSRGNLIAGPLNKLDVSVLAGYFTVQLDFGDVFDGTAMWLAIAVKCTGELEYTSLSPRQELTAAPYALSLQPGAVIAGAVGTVLTAKNKNDYGIAIAGTQPGYQYYDMSYFWEPGGFFGGRNGVIAYSKEPNGYGVVGSSSASTGTGRGVHGVSGAEDGVGVYGYATATGGVNRGVVGVTESINGYGVMGQGPRYGGFFETSEPDGQAVNGHDRALTEHGIGGYFSTLSDEGIGVFGQAIWGGRAGLFYGPVEVLGNLSKSGGSFKIDHPLDPANKYLYHSFVESPDMLNIYNGNVILDEDGTAWVELPEWFEALNGDAEHRSEFRYQLTCIGGFAPVYIAHKIERNRFQIAGGTPGLEVSWQVTGIRHDPYAETHRIPVEEDKPADELGTYLFPELYGQPEELGVDYVFLPRQETGAR